jgi:hypothetical protein
LRLRFSESPVNGQYATIAAWPRSPGLSVYAPIVRAKEDWKRIAREKNEHALNNECANVRFVRFSRLLIARGFVLIARNRTGKSEINGTKKVVKRLP